MRKLGAVAGVVAIYVLLAVATVGAQAQSATFTTQSYPLLGNTHVAADLNNDGILDLVGSGLDAAHVMLNNGTGTFSARVSYPAFRQTQDVAAGDYNSDGKVDLVVTNNSPDIMLSLLTGNGDGTFNAPVNFPNPSGMDSPAVHATDLNNDAHLDVVIGHSIACFTAPCVPARTISVMLGNGDGTFQPSNEIDVGGSTNRMSVGDFNRDGRKDLAIGSGNTRLFILLGRGDGTFTQQTLTLVPGGDPFSSSNDVVIADFNRDGNQDLAVSLGNGHGTAILLGSGAGTFTLLNRILDDAVDSPLALGAADFNLDGFVDIARGRGNGNSGLMDILHGNGDGTFRPLVRYLVPPNQSSIGGGFVVPGDFNLDGKADIALQVRGASPGLRILLNATAGGAPPSPSPTRTPTRTPTAPLVTATATNPPPQATLTPTRTPTRTPAVTATRPSDTVSITRAEYTSANRELRIEATSTSSSAVMRAYVTSNNQLIGTLTNKGGGRYEGRFTLSSNPQNVTVRSSLGGSASRAVTTK